jgi:hypothetical protein
LAGLAVTLVAVGVYAAYTVTQLRTLQRIQTQTIDRNRTDTLLLLRIQNNLNALALTMRDVLDTQEPYPLTAWLPQIRRICDDLEEALSREQKVIGAENLPAQSRYLADSFRQFRDSVDRVFKITPESEARTQIRLSLQARQASLAAAVSRLLVQNNESERQAAEQTSALYARVERNVYVFLAAMLVVIVLTSLYLVNYTRRLFEQVAELSQRRSDLARRTPATSWKFGRSFSPPWKRCGLFRTHSIR